MNLHDQGYTASPHADAASVWDVTTPTGETHIVCMVSTPYTCSCQGFTYSGKRKSCRHTEGILPLLWSQSKAARADKRHSIYFPSTSEVGDIRSMKPGRVRYYEPTGARIHRLRMLRERHPELGVNSMLGFGVRAYGASLEAGRP